MPLPIKRMNILHNMPWNPDESFDIPFLYVLASPTGPCFYKKPAHSKAGTCPSFKSFHYRLRSPPFFPAREPHMGWGDSSRIPLDAALCRRGRMGPRHGPKSSAIQVETMELDLIIRNGNVLDGTGSPKRRADVGIVGDRIAAVGDLSKAMGREVLNAKGRIVCPGFIDPHNHAHVEVDKGVPPCDNLVRQGITTIVAGNCGGSGWPVAEHFEKARKRGIKQNYAMLVGHNTIRRLAADKLKPGGFAEHDAIVLMQDAARRGMDEGAIGITVGYPAKCATTEEFIEVSKPVGKMGGVYASHIRSEGTHLLQALAEIIEVCENAEIPVQISHFKTGRPSVWDHLDIALAMIEDARRRGLDVSADRYPYCAWHGGSTNITPPWASGEASKRGGWRRMKDADIVDRFRRDVEEMMAGYGGNDRLMFTSLQTPDPEVDGKTPADLMKQWSCDLVEVAIRISEHGGVGAIGFTMCEENLRRILKHEAVMVGTDAHEEPFGRFATHPRNYGTYPRVLGALVREERLFPLPTAIRKMTSMPAEKFRLKDRGVLREKAYADVVVFDPKTVADNATFLNGHQYPSGIDFVIVNGHVAVREGKTDPGNFGVVIAR